MLPGYFQLLEKDTSFQAQEQAAIDSVERAKAIPAETSGIKTKTDTLSKEKADSVQRAWIAKQQQQQQKNNRPKVVNEVTSARKVPNAPTTTGVNRPRSARELQRTRSFRILETMDTSDLTAATSMIEFVQAGERRGTLRKS